VRFPSHVFVLLIPLTKMSFGIQQTMIARNIPHLLQSVLTSHHYINGRYKANVLLWRSPNEWPC